MNLPAGWADTPRNQFIAWLKSQEKREAREWGAWDGTYEHGARIVDAQCARIDEAKARNGWPLGLGA